jgi:HNH endonuclease
MLTAERMRELLDYDVETGVFVWKVDRSRTKCGAVAGVLNDKGYRLIGVDDHVYLAHRLAWLHVYGCWPPVEIDHINGFRSDNRLSNLREATRSENRINAKRKNTNTSGFKGVWRPAGRRKWYANIQIKNSRVYLGSFNTREEAYAAYCVAAAELHGEFARFA